MKLTYNIKHNKDFTKELLLAHKVAKYAIDNRDKLSSKFVKHLGLNSCISNAILYKYGRNRKAKSIHSVPLCISGCYIKRNGEELYIVPLKLMIPFNRTERVIYAEVSKQYVHITVDVENKEQITPTKHIGVDLNTTGHCAVVAVKETGKIYKLGKKSQHIHKKYKAMRKDLQKKGKFVAIASIKKRESHILKDINHKISRFIIDLAVKEEGGVQLEKLLNIKKTRFIRKSFRYDLNSWSYYQLGKFIEYKALLAGIPLTYIAPAYTSKACSKCGLIGNRNGKSFKCPSGHVEHADSNAAFNIALLSPSIVQLQAERDVCKGNSDVPQKAMAVKQPTLNQISTRR